MAQKMTFLWFEDKKREKARDHKVSKMTAWKKQIYEFFIYWKKEARKDTLKSKITIQLD